MRLRLAATQTSRFELGVAFTVLAAVLSALFSLLVEASALVATLLNLTSGPALPEILRTGCTATTRLTLHGIGGAVVHTSLLASRLLLALFFLELLFLIDLFQKLGGCSCLWALLCLADTLSEWFGLAAFCTIELLILAGGGAGCVALGLSGVD